MGAPRPYRACFRFYEELNDFLPARWRKKDVTHGFSGRPSVKDMIEGLGVPHVEVDLILVNGRSVGFDHPVRDGDRISVYPVFESLDIAPLVRLRPRPLRQSRFILDVHLGKLARALRLLGFDARYRNDLADPEIVRIAAEEARIILTRDRRLLKCGEVTRGYWVRSTRPENQVREILERFDLRSQARPFTRCMMCNGMLEAVDKHDVAHQLQPRTERYYDTFYRCGNCDGIYWEGSHFHALKERVRRWLGGGAAVSKEG